MELHWTWFDSTPFTGGHPLRFQLISSDFARGTPLECHQTSSDFKLVARGYPFRISVAFPTFCKGCLWDFIVFRNIPYHLQGFRLGISMGSQHFARGYPLGFNWISYDSSPFARGNPQDFHGFHTLCKGYPLGFHRTSWDLTLLQGHPIRISVVSLPFVRGIPQDFIWFLKILHHLQGATPYDFTGFPRILPGGTP